MARKKLPAKIKRAVAQTIADGSVPVIKTATAHKTKYPLIDENTLIQALLTEISPENIDKIRSGAVLSVIDAFDRRITRVQFLDILATALPLYDWLGSLQTVQRVDSINKKQKLTEESLAEAVAEYCSRSDAVRLTLLRCMRGVVACAPSDASIH